MRKTICLVTAAMIAAALCSCGNSAESPTDVTATMQRTTVTTLESVSAKAGAGEMDCTPIKLGNIIDRLYDNYPTAPAGEEQPQESGVAEQGEDRQYLEKTTGTTLTRFMYADMQFYTVNGKDSEGVAVMITSNGAYGFKCNINFKSDITNSLGEPQQKDIIPENQRFFMMGGEDAERLTYFFGDNRLDFIVVDDMLSMIVLTDTAIYDGFTA